MGDSNQLFESLFRSKIGEEGEVDFLKQLTSDHPYFSPAQFYLLLRTRETDADFPQLAARTAVLFNNPFWLNFQLLEAREKPAEITHNESLAGPLATSTDHAIIDHEDSSPAIDSDIQPGGEAVDERTSQLQLNEQELNIANNESSAQEEFVAQEESIEPATATEPAIDVQSDTESPF